MEPPMYQPKSVITSAAEIRTLLGPVFATRNPYAGFGLLFLILCSVGSIRLGVALAVTLGLLHSLARGARADSVLLQEQALLSLEPALETVRISVDMLEIHGKLVLSNIRVCWMWRPV